MNRRELHRTLMKMPAHFLNVDLDVFSPRPLDALAQAMEKCGAISLHCGRFQKGGYRASFEVGTCRLDADQTIQELGRIVRLLPAPARRLFDRAKLRDFNIGIQSAKEPHAFEIPVSPASLAVVTGFGARLSVTVYSPVTGKKFVAPSSSKGRKAKSR